VLTKFFKASSCAVVKKPALPPMSKLVRPSIPRCSNSLCQPRIVSSFSNSVGDFLTTPTLIQQHQGVGAARHARRRRPIARQRNQLAAILFAEKAAPNHAPIGIHQDAKCKQFVPRLQ
jgi:hypothetical protein